MVPTPRASAALRTARVSSTVRCSSECVSSSKPARVTVIEARWPSWMTSTSADSRDDRVTLASSAAVSRSWAP
jgi:hypothetical protein